MLHRLAAHFFMTDAAPAWSRPVAVPPRGQLEVQATVIHISDGTLEVYLEMSNDGQNWEDADAVNFISLSAVGFEAIQFNDVSARFVRLRYLLDTQGGGSGVCLLAAALRVQDLGAPSLEAAANGCGCRKGVDLPGTLAVAPTSLLLPEALLPDSRGRPRPLGRVPDVQYPAAT